MNRPVNILIVEDSATVREYLVGLFSARDDLRILATARNGRRALDMLKTLPRPDLITMDMHMPVMDGLEATRAIMTAYPAPILVVSSGPGSEEGGMVFKALEAGAVGAVRLPPGPGAPGHEEGELRLLESVRLLSEVKVVRRWQGHATTARPPGLSRSLSAPNMPAPETAAADTGALAPRHVVAVGASTGGPLAVKTVLQALGPDFPLPVLVVQHMAQGFIRGFADWLAEAVGMPVIVARDGLALGPGTVYIAPEDRHMEVTSLRTLRLHLPDARDPHTPSVDRLFRSVEKVFGPTAIAALLTGMGRDGAAELVRLRRCGALTLAQDEATSVIYGMPGEAVRLGGADHVLPPESIGETIGRIARLACPR